MTVDGDPRSDPESAGRGTDAEADASEGSDADYRFDPETVGPADGATAEADGADRTPWADEPEPDEGWRGALDLEPGPSAVGVLVGVAGLLFLIEPFVRYVPLGPVRARPVALSAVVLAAGFLLGFVVFLRRGRRTIAFGHGVFALAWGGLVAGVVAGSGLLLFGGVAVLVAGAITLVATAR